MIISLSINNFSVAARSLDVGSRYEFILNSPRSYRIAVSSDYESDVRGSAAVCADTLVHYNILCVRLQFFLITLTSRRLT